MAVSECDSFNDSDVVVVGSGGAGLAAGVAALVQGASVTLLERADKIGGTTAVSGGVPWIPNNHHMEEIGSSDTFEEAMSYFRRLASDRSDDVMLEAYVRHAPKVLRSLEDETELRFDALEWCDYRPEFPGGKFGRSVSPALFPKTRLGELGDLIRNSATFPVPFTMRDIEQGVDVLDAELIGDRLARGLLGTGRALIGGLLQAFIDRGGVLERGIRARKLIVEGDVVSGLEAEREGRTLRFRARRGVILACGGFEWDAQLSRDLLQGEIGPASPPGNEGDGLRMAMEVGAATANLDEAWWMPVMKIPGEEYDGRPLHRLATAELTKTGSIMVNRHGRRFVNEACNYNDLGRAFFVFDASRYEYPNKEAWIILHRPYLEHYPFMTRYPGDPLPAWLVKGQTLAELAEKAGIDAIGLERTVADFNAVAREGRDPEFGRGESHYDRYHGDAAREGALRTLGPIEEAPFYACRVYPGALGTKGGPRINQRAEVIGLGGSPISGLYAAGNVTASVTGRSYPGAGGTIGPAIVFGHIAGQQAAHRPISNL